MLYWKFLSRKLGKKGNKRHPDWKGRKIVLFVSFANDTILYTENPERFTIKLLEQVNNFSKDAR